MSALIEFTPLSIHQFHPASLQTISLGWNLFGLYWQQIEFSLAIEKIFPFSPFIQESIPGPKCLRIN